MNCKKRPKSFGAFGFFVYLYRVKWYDMIKRSLILIMVLLCSVYTMAQDGVWTFSGKVVDAKTQKALSYVSVTDRNVGTVTNEEGEFTLAIQAQASIIRSAG
jgi:hypothetical protein